MSEVHTEELHNLYSSPNNILMIKSKTIKEAGRVAGAGKMRNAHRIV
jgi:hypothetical protein